MVLQIAYETGMTIEEIIKEAIRVYSSKNDFLKGYSSDDPKTDALVRHNCKAREEEMTMDEPIIDLAQVRKYADLEAKYWQAVSMDLDVPIPEGLDEAGAAVSRLLARHNILKRSNVWCCSRASRAVPSGLSLC